MVARNITNAHMLLEYNNSSVHTSTTIVHCILPAILKSQPNAISSPPPNAKPSIAASIGTGRSVNDNVSARNFATILGTSLSGMLARSFRSAPTT